MYNMYIYIWIHWLPDSADYWHGCCEIRHRSWMLPPGNETDAVSSRSLLLHTLACPSRFLNWWVVVLNMVMGSLTKSLPITKLLNHNTHIVRAIPWDELTPLFQLSTTTIEWLTHTCQPHQLMPLFCQTATHVAVLSNNSRRCLANHSSSRHCLTCQPQKTHWPLLKHGVAYQGSSDHAPGT